MDKPIQALHEYGPFSPGMKHRPVKLGGTNRGFVSPTRQGMTIDNQLIAQVQQAAHAPECIHKLRTIIACYQGFVGLLETNPEFRDRAMRLEATLRTFLQTGTLPSTR
jgi:hypothetical protein